ncbi:hypothetical protein ACIRJM_45225 [Streptomyces sp. NPDC102405]|uniref:hypothetical protein n=1 Tax=Streptomyces sp. NPDC102405 TaxID=3366170 RepID=UPI0037FA77FC
MKVDIAKGHPKSLKGLELNARYMRHEQYQQLVTNLREDETLTSTPFIWHDTRDRHPPHPVRQPPREGRRRSRYRRDLLAGDQRPAHREQAPRHPDLAQQHRRRRRPVDLKTLYEKIDDLDLRQYAGIDDATLELLADLDSPSLGEANLTFQTLAIVFLPDDLKEAQDVLRDALGLAASSDAVWVAALRQYDQTMAALDLASKSADVTNVATAFGLILESFKDHAHELVDGWFDRDTGEPKHHGMAPLLTLFHTDAMPTKAAAVVEKALQQAVARGEVPAEHRYKALELWAHQYLDTPA